MAFAACYECGKQISTAAAACPQCGAPKQPPTVAPASPIVPILPGESSEICPAQSGFSDQVRGELVAATKVGRWAILAGVIYGFFIPSVALGRNPTGVLVAFACGVVAFRAWLRRRTARVILDRASLDGFGVNVYFPALWSYAWRSAIVFIPLASIIGLLASESPAGVGETVGAVVAIWLLPSLFVFDVPFWVRRRVNRITRTHTTIPDGRARTENLSLKIKFDLNDGVLDENGTNTFEVVRLLRELADDLEKKSGRDNENELRLGWRRELRDEIGLPIGTAVVCGETHDRGESDERDE